MSKRNGKGGTVHVTLQALTDGSSLAYRFVGEETTEKVSWQLYRDEIRIEQGQQIEVIASRLGYEPSPAVAVSN